MYEFRWVLFENVLLQIEQVGTVSPACAAFPFLGVRNNSDERSAVLVFIVRMISEKRIGNIHVREQFRPN